MTRAEGERRPRPPAAKVAPPPRAAAPEPAAPAMSSNPALSTNPALPRASSGSKIVPPEEMLADLRNFVRDLAMSDNLAFALLMAASIASIYLAGRIAERRGRRFKTWAGIAAIIGPLSKVVSMQTIFLVAGFAPVLLAAIAMVAAKMPRDEIENPLR